MKPFDMEALVCVVNAMKLKYNLKRRVIIVSKWFSDDKAFGFEGGDESFIAIGDGCYQRILAECKTVNHVVTSRIHGIEVRFIDAPAESDYRSEVMKQFVAAFFRYVEDK